MISSKRLPASAPIREIAYELKDQLERSYGSKLKGVVLFIVRLGRRNRGL
jgi:hypothetical protein